MTGQEREGQRRVLFGVESAHCDLCGMAVPVSDLSDVESDSAFAEHDHVNRICRDCRERVFRGEIDVESFLIEEDDRSFTRDR